MSEETFGTAPAATSGSLDLTPNQIEAHITRLRAVQSGLAKYREHDYRAAGAVAEIDAVVEILKSEAPPTGQFGPESEPYAEARAPIVVTPDGIYDLDGAID